jgi:hypothetical protein
MTLDQSPTAVEERPATTTSGPPSVDDLIIKEARRRQRRRRRFVAGGVAFGLAGLALGLLWPASTPQRPIRPAKPPTVQHPVAPVAATLSAGSFAGTWRVHTFTITILANGTGSAAWPTHVPCSAEGPVSAATACDQFTPGTIVVGGSPVQVVNISDGGRATIRLISVSGTTASAVISGSTVPSTLPDGQAGFKVTTQDLLYITPSSRTTGSPFGRSGFCGPSALALNLQQQMAEGINCGA